MCVYLRLKYFKYKLTGRMNKLVRTWFKHQNNLDEVFEELNEETDQIEHICFQIIQYNPLD